MSFQRFILLAHILAVTWRKSCKSSEDNVTSSPFLCTALRTVQLLQVLVVDYKQNPKNLVTTLLEVKGNINTHKYLSSTFRVLFR